MNKKPLVAALMAGLTVTILSGPKGLTVSNAAVSPVQLAMGEGAKPKPSVPTPAPAPTVPAPAPTPIQVKLQIRQVVVVSEDRCKLLGDGDFRDRTIRLATQTGEPLWAKFDVAQQVFVVVGGRKMVPGIPYEVQADWATIPAAQAACVIPNLLEAKQVAPNCIQLLFDRPVDVKTATRASSYVIRSNIDKPKDIASIGKNGAVSPMATLKRKRVVITPLDSTNTRFAMTFTAKATPGVQYTVLPYGITTPDRSGYHGINFTESSDITFIARRF